MGAAILNACTAITSWAGNTLIDVAQGIGGVGSSVVSGTISAVKAFFVLGS